MYAHIMCVAYIYDNSQPTHEYTHGGEDNVKCAETNRFEQVVLKLGNN